MTTGAVVGDPAILFHGAVLGVVQERSAMARQAPFMSDGHRIGTKHTEIPILLCRRWRGAGNPGA